MSTVPFHVTEITTCAELRIVEADTEHRFAVLAVISGGVRHSLRLIDPRPLDPLVEIFGDCHEIRLIDLNAAHANQLEFGRYRLEIRDEDGVIGEVLADGYEVFGTTLKA